MSIFQNQSYRLKSLTVKAILILAATTWCATAAPVESLILNSGSSAPLIVKDNEGFYPQLAKELFRRLNIEIQVKHLKSSRSLKNAYLGLDDGVIGRVKAAGKKHKSLIRVPEKIIELGFVAYSNDKSIVINSWKDLKNYNVAYIRGWKIFENKVTEYKNLQKVKSPYQLFKLLKRKRTDVILFQNIPGRYIMKQMGYYPHEHKPYLDKRDLYIFMHEKHNGLIQDISTSLKKMKQDGVYQKLYNKYITDVIRPIKSDI